MIVIIVGLILGSVILFFSVENTAKNIILHIEAEDAHNIEPPFKVINDLNASGHKAVTTTMRSDELEASLEYIIKVKREGKYRFWANCYWPGGCNNSFIFQIDEGNRYVFGNDKRSFDIWHWVKGPVILISKGDHVLKIWNKEKFSMLDKIIFNNDPSANPNMKDNLFTEANALN